MTIAFAGDATRKAVLLDRIDRALADGSLSFASGANARADPVAPAIDGGDPAEYARVYGYPPALAGVLAPVAARLDTDAAVRFVRDWAAAVTPGADLSAIPALLMQYMLDDDGLRRTDIALTDRLIALHRGVDTPHADWAALRRDIVVWADASTDPADGPAIAVWEAACWPVARGYGVLAATFIAWQQLGGLAPGWSADREAKVFAILDRIRRDHEASGDAVQPDYPATLRHAYPDLARGFEDNLDHVNRGAHDRARAFAARIIALLDVAK